MNESQIFMAALRLADPAERATYLDAACAGDPTLRAAVQDLLRVQANDPDFLERPAMSPTETMDAPPATATAGPRAAGPGLVVAGRYKLLEEIGGGGMGTVWMAQQTEPVKRLVAVKLIKPGMDSRQVLARFEAERQALALMDHPNIAKVHDAGATPDGRPFFVMELVKGVPITTYCDDYQLTPRQRLELFVPVCQAVQHAHQKGVIHRDLKPSNVLVALYDGRPVPKVIDFGVAKAAGQSLTDKTLVTGFGAIVGTLEYMSPEQAEINQLDIDTRSDVYSLGVLLYELLAGSPPFTKKDLGQVGMLEMLRVIREQEPTRPSTKLSTADGLPTLAANRGTEPTKLRKLVRGELDWIVMKALEKDRTRRYETANGLAHDIERYLADEPVRACPPSAAYRMRKFVRRNKRFLAPVGLAVLALVAGAIVSAWQAFRATQAESATSDQLRLTKRAEHEAHERLYRSLVAQAHGSRLSRRVGQRFGALETLAEATRMAREWNLPETDILDLRNETIACLALPDLRVAKEWDGVPDGTFIDDFAGTLERHVRVDRQGAVSIRRVADDTELYRLPGMGPGETFPLLSPDGNYFARARGFQFELWNLAGAEPVRLLEGPMVAFGFSPDSRRCARVHPDGSLVLYDLPSGREVKALGARSGAIGGLAFHPTGRQIAIGHAGGVEIRDLETDTVVAELPQRVQSHGGACFLAWHPDGKSLAVVGNDCSIHIWDVAARKEIARLVGHKNAGIGCAFNHAGTLLASGGWDGTLRLWDPRTGQQLFRSYIWETRPRFSPDDRLLTTGGDGHKRRLSEVATPLGYRTLGRDPVPGRSEYFSVAVHPNGRLLAAGMRNEAGLWDLVTGDYLAKILLGPGITHVLFEPSGALLTNGQDGLRRWPVRADPGSAERLRIGPPERLALPGSDCVLRCSRDGRVLASAQYDGGLVLHADRPGQPIPLRPHDDVRYIAVSPKGGLVATSSQANTKVRVWQALSGKLEMELPAETFGQVDFSPDGKWLGTAGRGCRLWNVNGWQRGPEIGGSCFAFSPDSKLLAVELGTGVVRLLDPDSGREYARLEDPNQDRSAMTFSPDGSQLVTFSGDSNAFHVWDLRALRQELAKLDLDWDLPPYGPSKVDARQPLQIRVDLGELKLSAADQLAMARQVIDQRRRAVEANPNDAPACNNLAWEYLTAPEPLRDWKAALPLAQKAVRLNPGSIYQNTLGLAYYRAGRYREAVEVLEANLRRPDDSGLAWDLYFLAMCYQKLGDPGRARQLLDLGDQLARAHRETVAQYEAELAAFRAEARELLGIGAKKD